MEPELREILKSCFGDEDLLDQKIIEILTLVKEKLPEKRFCVRHKDNRLWDCCGECRQAWGFNQYREQVLKNLGVE